MSTFRIVTLRGSGLAVLWQTGTNCRRSSVQPIVAVDGDIRDMPKLELLTKAYRDWLGDMVERGSESIAWC